MNESHHIDDLFRNKLGEFEMAPPMHLFDAVQSKRRKPKGFWFWLSNKRNLLVILGLFTITIFIWAASTFFFQPSDNIPSAIEPAPATSENNELADLGEEELITSLTTNNSEEKTTAIIDNTSNVIGESQISNKQSEQASQQDARSRDTSPASNPSKKSSSAYLNIGDRSSSIDQAKEKVAFDNSVKTNETPIGELAPNIEESEEIVPPFQSLEAFDLLSALPLQSIPQNSAVEHGSVPFLSFKNGNGVNYYFEVFGGPVSASRTLNPVSEDFINIVRTKNQAEQSILSSSFGLRMAFVNRKGWSLRTGIQFTQIRESFDYINRVPEVTQVFDPNGGGVIQDTVYIASGPVIAQNNQFSTLDIPVIVGFEKRINKWTLSAHAGPRFNIAFQRQGFLINENLEAVDYASQEGQQALRNSLGISWYGSLGLQYEIQPGVHLLLEPNVNFGQASITRAPYPVEQRYFTSGLSIGIRKLMLR